jgi:hypothetical protein
MLGTVLTVFSGFGFLIWRSYRMARVSGHEFRPEGKLRWDDDPPSS